MENARLPDLRARAAEADRADPLRTARPLFHLPDSLIYLDGNSLGCLTYATRERLRAVIDEEWGEGLISSWNEAGWVDLPARVGARIAKLVGAEEGALVACDSTSVNLFKVLAAALALRPGRRVIVSERSNFPTDLYMAEGLAALLGQGHELRLADSAEEIPALVDGDTAVLMLTQVNYRTGALHDMAALSKLAEDRGALALWDLAHSAGALPVDLAGDGADFAIGCGYKYLNGGPGAPAFLYVAPRHQDAARQPLSGWFGHAAPFAFETGYTPARGVSRFLTGTPAILGLSSLDAALGAFEGIEMAALRAKSMALTDFFVEAVETLCEGHGLTLASPREASRRGSQISFYHAKAYGLCQALIAAGVVGDFRAPDILRFGFAPLYNSFADAIGAAEIMAALLASGRHEDEAFQRRNTVT
ncbi:kynureninase [Aureimonas ureilytica]|uniref:kynureninase n=1 Tax=Aureimonas ureilytica TaxID=401562 RepID=UPI000366AA0D|nr:kynureninase [Aureimonas ureilytica]